MQATAAQRTDKWYQDRLGLATSSQFDKVLATVKSGEASTRRNYRADLVLERLTGKQADSFPLSELREIQWGIENEPLARLYYMGKTRQITEECGFFRHATLAAGASPDGLIGRYGTLEIKCPKTSTHIATLRRSEKPGATAQTILPAKYYAQVQGQLWITGRKWARFVSFDPRLPENARILIVHVPRNDAYIKYLEAKVTQFLIETDAELKFVQGFTPKEELWTTH